MSVQNTKAYQHFKLRVKPQNIMNSEIIFMSGTDGWIVPSGVLIWDTTLSKLKVGTGSGVETITSA